MAWCRTRPVGPRGKFSYGNGRALLGAGSAAELAAPSPGCAGNAYADLGDLDGLGGDAAGGMDMRFWLPACASPALMRFLMSACQELRRAGDHLAGPDALQVRRGCKAEFCGGL